LRFILLFGVLSTIAAEFASAESLKDVEAGLSER
jgi:hypothetical protein